MPPSSRPKRFAVIPLDTRPAASLLPATLASRQRPGALLRAIRGSAARGAGTPAVGLKVVNSSPPDGAVLVEARGLTAEQVKVHTPGARVFEEQWYRLDRPARPWMKQSGPLKKPRTVSGKTVKVTVSVRQDAPGRRLVRDARVTVMLDEARGLGLEATTDRYGRVTFELSDKVREFEAVYVDPLHGAWPVVLHRLPLVPKGMTLMVPALDLKAQDVRGLVHGQAEALAGRGVKVGVVDTGVGRHAALKVAGGRNTTEESPLLWRDEDGHGTHVAGVIASVAAGWRRGEAPAVQLHAYRIFESGDDEASTFAISSAIKQAAADGCDLVNLSIGGSEADGAVRDAIERAWEVGCVCVAATGNDGRAEVDYPARYPKSVAVSAFGLENSWPAGTFFEWTLGKARGKAIDGRQSFFADFSNRGDKVSLTAPGVAVVSTIFGDRWGVMSGTSMATPIATGVLARRLAASPVLALPRNAARAAAIVKLATDAAEDLGFPARMQGHGLAR